MFVILSLTVFADAMQPTDSQTTIIDQNTRQVAQTYQLPANIAFPDDIPQTFDADGFRYTQEGIVSTATTGEDVQTVSVDRSLSSSTKTKVTDFADTLDYGQDGYSGTLTRDDETFSVTGTGIKNVSKTVTAVKEYSGLARNDMSVIPETMDGLALKSVSWTDTTTGQSVKGYTVGLPGPYSAVAHYAGTRTATVTTGYAAKVTYSGSVSKNIVTGSELTVTYTGNPIPQPAPFPIYTLIAIILGIVLIGGGILWLYNKHRKGARQ